jgi:hypothetical protein
MTKFYTAEEFTEMIRNSQKAKPKGPGVLSLDDRFWEIRRILESQKQRSTPNIPTGDLRELSLHQNN